MVLISSTTVLYDSQVLQQQELSCNIKFMHPTSQGDIRDKIINTYCYIIYARRLLCLKSHSLLMCQLLVSDRMCCNLTIQGDVDKVYKECNFSS